MFIKIAGRIIVRVFTIYIKIVFDPIMAFLEKKESSALRSDNVQLYQV